MSRGFTVTIYNDKRVRTHSPEDAIWWRFICTDDNMAWDEVVDYILGNIYIRPDNDDEWKEINGDD